MIVQVVQDQNTGFYFLRKAYFFGLLYCNEFLDRSDFKNGKIDTWITRQSVQEYCNFRSLEEVDKAIESYIEKNKTVKLKVIKTVKV